MTSAILHPDGLHRCPWPEVGNTIYVDYHDQEWGVPEWDDRALFEKLVLDGFQAGLSWITILRKRENFRRAFDGFQPEKIARYDARKKAALMKDAGIVRNKLKAVRAGLSGHHGERARVLCAAVGLRRRQTQDQSLPHHQAGAG